MFDKVNSIIFIAALSDYCMTILEDRKQNAMLESLTVFENTINLDQFKKKSIILFLNKKDLFEQQIQQKPLKEYFPDFGGQEGNSDAALKHIEQLYRGKDKFGSRQIFVYPTTATDTSNIKKIAGTVIGILLKETLESVGFT